jgi:hypothetical protein
LSIPSTGAPPSGVKRRFRIFDRSVLIVAADTTPPAEDGVGAVGIEMDLDPRLDEVRPHRTFPDLEAADQIGNQGVKFGRRSPASGGHFSTPNPRPRLGEVYLRTYLVRTAGLEPALSERNRFSYHFGFRRRQVGVRGLDCPFAMASRPKAPPVQSLHLPSTEGLARDWPWARPVSVPRL